MKQSELRTLNEISNQLEKYIQGNVDYEQLSTLNVQLKKTLKESEKTIKKSNADLADIALNYWRISNWLDETDAERKLAAKSALRHIGEDLETQGIEFKDLIGQKYDNGYAADVMGIETANEVPEEELIVIETVRPIILRWGNVIQYGQVILGDKIVENEKESGTADTEIPKLMKMIEKYCSASYREKAISRKLRWCSIKLDKWLRSRKK